MQLLFSNKKENTCNSFFHSSYLFYQFPSLEAEIIHSTLYEALLPQVTTRLIAPASNSKLRKGRGATQYRKSKEHRPNPIVQMGLFLDGDGFPLFSMDSGVPALTNCQTRDFTPLLLKIQEERNFIRSSCCFLSFTFSRFCSHIRTVSA